MNDLKRKARLVVIVCLARRPCGCGHRTVDAWDGGVKRRAVQHIIDTRDFADRTDPSRWDRWQRAFADKIFAMRRVSLTDDQIHTAVVERLPCVPALRICTAPILGARLRLANSCPS